MKVAEIKILNSFNSEEILKLFSSIFTYLKSWGFTVSEVKGKESLVFEIFK